MKKVLIYLIGGVILVAFLVTGYVQYKFFMVENSISKYLINEKRISETDFKTEPFIANLPGVKNWMVSVKLEGDSATYFYYVNKKYQIVLESYVKNGTEHVEDRSVK